MYVSVVHTVVLKFILIWRRNVRSRVTSFLLTADSCLFPNIIFLVTPSRHLSLFAKSMEFQFIDGDEKAGVRDEVMYGPIVYTWNVPQRQQC